MRPQFLKTLLSVMLEEHLMYSTGAECGQTGADSAAYGGSKANGGRTDLHLPMGRA
jgi:hypothetical protein